MAEVREEERGNTGGGQGRRESNLRGDNGQKMVSGF